MPLQDLETKMNTDRNLVSYPCFYCIRKPLAGRVVQKKPSGDDVDRKTPFA